MSSHAILDPSPAHSTRNGTRAAGGTGIGKGLPSTRPLKRSASAASLPSPPQTVKTRKRHGSSRSRSRCSDRDSDNETAGSVSENERPVLGKLGGRVLFRSNNKKQRTDRLDAVVAALSDADAENSFWEGPANAPPATDLEDEDQEHRSRSPSPDLAPVLLRARARAQGQTLASPPPSRRQPKAQAAAVFVTSKPSSLVAPQTPKGTRQSPRIQQQKRKEVPMRDSPNNPFLDDSPKSVSGEPVEPRTPTPSEHVEKPTISYVFRGVKTTFANPLYNLSPTTRARALLPVDHPDYSPDQACGPKLLFPEARARARTRRSRTASPTRSNGTKRNVASAKQGVATMRGDGWDSDSGDDELAISPPKRLFLAQR